MDKGSFIQEIHGPLKAMGYRKHGNYWYKEQNDLLLCVNVQGSQWDKNDYYVNIGVALAKDGIEFPTLLHWTFDYRCTDKRRSGNCDVNILPEVLLAQMENIFSDLTDTSGLPEYYRRHRAIRCAGRYVIL